MGFLGSLVSKAISSAVEKGITNALGKVFKSAGIQTVQGQRQAPTTQKEQAEEIGAEVVKDTSMFATTKPEDLKVLEEFKQKLPQYPVWTVGGWDFELEEVGEREGHPEFLLKLHGPEVLLNAYKLLMEEAGFKLYGGRWSDVMVKVVDGECYCFTTTDAIQDDNIWVGYFVSKEYMPQ